MINVPGLKKNREFWKILHKLHKKYLFNLQLKLYNGYKRNKIQKFHFSTSENTVKVKCIHIVYIKTNISCIYAESGEQRERNKCKLLHGNQQNVDIL
jgi:hypothetical protein